VDFKGGTVVTARFKQPPSVEALRAAIQTAGVHDAVIQPVLDRPGEFLIRVAQMGPAPAEATPQQQQQVGVDPARARLGQALKTFGEGNAEILGTEAVSAIASSQLRTQAIA